MSGIKLGLLWSSNTWDSLYSKMRDLLVTKYPKKNFLLWINFLGAL
jgi:hypothetical protein